MRIGLVIYNSLETVSGGYLYDRKLVEHLRKCGDEVEIISLPYRNYATHLTHNLQSLIPNLLHVSHFDVLLQDELNHPSLFFLNRFIRGRYPIISIVHHLRISEQQPTDLSDKSIPTQNKVHAGGLRFALPRFQSPQFLFYRIVERAYLNSVDGFVFNSEATKRVVESVIARSALCDEAISERDRYRDCFAKNARNDAPRSIVAYPSGDRFNSTLTPDHVRARAAQTPLKILFVGNLIPRKGLHTLLDALEKVSGNWELVIVGNSNLDRRYAESIQRRLTPQMKMLGSLNDAQLTAQFANSHLLVVPSQYEGFGIVYLEGMGFGLPAIATTSGGAGEIITHGENGFLIERGDSESLARNLQSLISDCDLLIQMSLNALERFKKHPTWEESMGKAREFLKRNAYSV
ncbi:MAG: glycosyltransferase family 4 protein [Chloroflexi bacterium]|nr:glycosyltransferase family 4 protein [Chloroflexota bacterium]